MRKSASRQQARRGPARWKFGDRVRCDVRYTELKIPESEYRAFFDQCMGKTGSTNKPE